MAGGVNPSSRQRGPQSMIEVVALLADLRPSVGLSSESLLPLSQFVSRLNLSGDHLSTPFDALLSASAVAVHAVLERTAVVSDSSGERRLARQADVLVNPWQLEWRPEVKRRRGRELVAGHPARLRRCSDCGRTPAETRFYDLTRTYCSDCQRRRQRPTAPSSASPPLQRTGASNVRKSQRTAPKPLRLDGRVRDGSDLCHPRWCEIGSRPHEHCACGLPKRVGVALCQWCGVERLDPACRQETCDADSLAWDGQSYPARRHLRISSPDSEGCWRLLVAILARGHEECAVLEG